MSTISNNLFSYLSSLYELPNSPTHEMTVIESPSTAGLDKPKAYTCLRPSSKVRVLVSMVKFLPVDLEQRLLLSLKYL